MRFGAGLGFSGLFGGGLVPLPGSMSMIVVCVNTPEVTIVAGGILYM